MRDANEKCTNNLNKTRGDMYAWEKIIEKGIHGPVFSGEIFLQFHITFSDSPGLIGS
jgi:hypothetical protein